MLSTICQILFVYPKCVHFSKQAFKLTERLEEDTLNVLLSLSGSWWSADAHNIIKLILHEIVSDETLS